jgi:hypothetical protein
VRKPLLLLLLIIMAARSIKFESFPRLVIDREDVTGSWRKWLRLFNLRIEMANINLGTEDDGQGNMVPVLRGRKKLLALFHAIGEDGMELLESLGINTVDEGVTYEVVMDRLRAVYGAGETVYVKTMKFVTVSQVADEDENEYLIRVEKLSRTLNFGENNDAVRQSFALAVAVNGLRDEKLRTKLMQQANLNWEELTNTLRARRMAIRSSTIIQDAKYGGASVKSEISEVSDSEDTTRQAGSGAGKYGAKRKDEGKTSSYKYKRSSESGRSHDRFRKFDRKLPEWRRSRSRSSSYERDVPVWKKKEKTKMRSPSPIQRNEKCYFCHERGHMIRFCPKIRCFVCQGKGHTTRDCRRKRSSSRSSISSRDSSNSRGSPRRHVRFTRTSKSERSKS